MKKKLIVWRTGLVVVILVLGYLTGVVLAQYGALAQSGAKPAAPARFTESRPIAAEAVVEPSESTDSAATAEAPAVMPSARTTVKGSVFADGMVMERIEVPVQIDVPVQRRAPVATHRSKEAAEIAKQSADLEKKSLQVALQIRQQLADDSSDEKAMTPLRQELQDTITKAFETRQRLQQVDVKELKQRLEAVEQRIQKREEHREAIIQSRIAELLDEGKDLRWNPTGTTYISSGATIDRIQARTEDPFAARQVPLAGPSGRVEAAQPPATGTSASPSDLLGQMAAQQARPSSGRRTSRISSAGTAKRGASDFATGVSASGFSLPAASSSRQDVAGLYASLAAQQHYAETRRALIDTEFAVKQAEEKLRGIEKLARNNAVPASELSVAKAEFEKALQHADLVKREHETQLRLLAHDHESACLALKAAEEIYEVTQGLYKHRLSKDAPVTKARLAVEQARSRVDSIKAMLDLHEQARPKKPKDPSPAPETEEAPAGFSRTLPEPDP